MNVSVAMTTYNGEKYLKEQLDSIICQLEDNDEIVISDDGSTDGTLKILLEYKSKYPFIKIYNGPKKGVFLNFNNALIKCNNEIIFLCDQDDIWMDEKIKTVCSVFENDSIDIVLHNGYHFCDNNEEKRKMIYGYKKGVLKNWVFSDYWGCCMAIRTSFINKFLPFVVNGCAHDQLIGLLGERYASTVFLNLCLTKHRIHEKNLTRQRKLISKINFRVKLLYDYMMTMWYGKYRKYIFHQI